jgi:hypothetical protein
MKDIRLILHEVRNLTPQSWQSNLIQPKFPFLKLSRLNIGKGGQNEVASLLKNKPDL